MHQPDSDYHPEKVKVIAYGAFLGCDNLKDIYYPGTNAQWNTIKIVENDNDILKTAAIHYRAAEPSSTEPLNPKPSNPSASDAFLRIILHPISGKVMQ